MSFLLNTYQRYADEGNVDRLAFCSMFDERVYDVVEKNKLVPRFVEALPSPAAAQFLSRGMIYDSVNEEVIRNFVKICMMLSRYRSVEEAAALSELIGNCGLPEQYRMNLFNFSETYRHMILSQSYFPQRAVLRLLSYIFCDDFMSDAVAQLQYKSDILNHVNKVFMDTPDFVSWRYSVRVMSLAGGYNEDRSDVERTELLTRVVTGMLPDFLVYFTAGYFYAAFRFYPRRVRGITPKWLARHRALFSATCCGLLGMNVNSLLEYRIYKQKILFELRKSQELRRRRGAARRDVAYEKNSYFDNIEGVTRRIFAMQMTTYAFTSAALVTSLVPLTSVKFPKWMGDVAWRHPFVPRFFPVLVNLHSASRCLVPFIVAPFVGVSILRLNETKASLYDYYVEGRWRLWHRRVDVAFDTSTEVDDVDITKSKKNS